MFDGTSVRIAQLEIFMAKVEIEMELNGFKIDGFKVRIKADREDIPQIRSEIGRQFMSVLQPPAALIDESTRKQVPSTVVPQTTNENGAGGGRGKGRRSKSAGNGSTDAKPVEWQHEPSKWGMPKQKWKAGKKVLWLLYVAKNEQGPTEMSAAVISETFNSKFKQFGTLKRSSMPSILGSLKTSQPALIMDDTTKTPNMWFLSEQGSKAAEALVQEAKTIEVPNV
jgi:hypothetical protein